MRSRSVLASSARSCSARALIDGSWRGGRGPVVSGPAPERPFELQQIGAQDAVAAQHDGALDDCARCRASGNAAEPLELHPR
jgi:hypothetical protein